VPGGDEASPAERAPEEWALDELVPEQRISEEDYAEETDFLTDEDFAEATFVEPGGAAPDFVEPGVRSGARDNALFDAPGEDTEPVAVPLDAGPHRALTDREKAMLVFERKWWRHPGSKEQAIREAFDWSPTQYYQRLNALLDMPAAAEFEPLVVGRLQRLRATRRRARSGR
jgi:hypothetical protein